MVKWTDSKRSRPQACTMQFNREEYREKFVRGLEDDKFAADIRLYKWTRELNWQPQRYEVQAPR